MNPEVKKLWVAALRSGEYPQGRGMLKTSVANPGPTCYCCLGVLCELYSKETGDSVLYHDNLLPPPKVYKWADIDHGGPPHISVWAGMQATYLTTLNDDGVTFSEIANIIEEQL